MMPETTCQHCGEPIERRAFPLDNEWRWVHADGSELCGLSAPCVATPRDENQGELFATTPTVRPGAVQDFLDYPSSLNDPLGSRHSDAAIVAAYILGLEERLAHFEQNVARPAFEQYVDGFLDGRLPELPHLPNLPEIQYETFVAGPPVVVASGRYYGDTQAQISATADRAFADFLGMTCDQFWERYDTTVTDAAPADRTSLTGTVTLWGALVTCYEKEES